ncbi:hypothetical protein PV10_03251 [Exophiala mesophila]|uniref:Hydantoinase/oxoprolinase n=1 Tax=Exophiala mesophila TaxID=212818 RepID=A0A0D1Y4N7_EXOME|nr:uncharacterized protein PV10_03251 [Exophiala mesophila]KIV95621.1 hypothetical protein PV10_03251 [Exophiala mesophila]
MFCIGVDVGGTNTDAAIIDLNKTDTASRGVLATCKTSTTPNVTNGIKTAVEQILETSKVDTRNILNVAVGTTHFVNAVVENDARRLSRVAVFRLCGPYTRKIPPFSDFPYALRDIIAGPCFYLDGGLEIDGREIAPLNVEQIKAAAEGVAQAGIKFIAIIGVFSALDHAGIHERRCKDLLKDFQPQISVVCSHSIGGLDFLPRENATILNASILSFARKTVNGFRRAMSNLQLTAPLYLTQNDGTLLDAAVAAELPIKTFASGPTNSLIGAAYLQGYGYADQRMSDSQILVIDVGGTTTDICALLPSGFPRQAPNFVEVGGIRTAFSMPEVLSIGLGGGSKVRQIHGTNKVSVGPDSVAHRLTTDALVFQGNVLTSTDIMVAAKAADIGNPTLVAHLSEDIITEAKIAITAQIERAIDKMKVSSAPVTVILVGGGSFLVNEPLPGVDKVLRPPHHDSANAVGAAIAKVAGEVSMIEILANVTEEHAIEKATQAAVDAAVTNGANAEDTRVVDITKIPLQYVFNKATRIVVKAVGSLAVNQSSAEHDHEFSISDTYLDDDTEEQVEVDKAEVTSIIRGSLMKPCLDVDLVKYRPEVRNGVWMISPVDVELIASGAGILGTGGGGSPYLMALYTLDILRREGKGKIRVIKPESLDDNKLCVFGSGYGAPSVSNERLGSGHDVFLAIESLNEMLKVDDFQGVVADEIGGGNGIVTFPSSARFDRPVVDCDLMGRAYPTLEHSTPHVYGAPVAPCVISDCKGNSALMLHAETNTRLESMVRKMCIELGNSTALATCPLKGEIIKKYAIPNTVSQAWYLGRAVRMARQNKTNLIDAMAEISPVTLLYRGKIIDVSRDVSGGYTMGRCVLGPLSQDEDDYAIEERDTARGMSPKSRETRHLVIPFQNEYLYAAYLSPTGSSSPQEEQVVVSMPDLISVLDSDGEALGSPDLRYGLKVSVIAMPAHPLWTDDPRGLKIGGPEYFKLGFEYFRDPQVLMDYRKPRSVIDEFDVRDELAAGNVG